MTEQELIEMPLHSKVSIYNNGITKEWVTRVVGGWIYSRQQFIDNRGTSRPADTVTLMFETATFVPEINRKHK